MEGGSVNWGTGDPQKHCVVIDMVMQGSSGFIWQVDETDRSHEKGTDTLGVWQVGCAGTSYDKCRTLRMPY